MWEMRLLPRSELKNAICYAYIRNWHHILIAVAERSPVLLFGWHKKKRLASADPVRKRKYNPNWIGLLNMSGAPDRGVIWCNTQYGRFVDVRLQTMQRVYRSGRLQRGLRADLRNMQLCVPFPTKVSLLSKHSIVFSPIFVCYGWTRVPISNRAASSHREKQGVRSARVEVVVDFHEPVHLAQGWCCRSGLAKLEKLCIFWPN